MNDYEIKSWERIVAFPMVLVVCIIWWILMLIVSAAGFIAFWMLPIFEFFPDSVRKVLIPWKIKVRNIPENRSSK